MLLSLFLLAHYRFELSSANANSSSAKRSVQYLNKRLQQLSRVRGRSMIRGEFLPEVGLLDWFMGYRAGGYLERFVGNCHVIFGFETEFKVQSFVLFILFFID